MKVREAAVLEPDATVRRELLEGLRKAGLRARALDGVEAAGREQVVLLGPSLPRPAAVARRIREQSPAALVLQARRQPGKAAHADGVVPLPLSPRDLAVRLPELLRLREASFRRAGGEARAAPSRPGPGAGEGILDPLTAFYAFRHFKEVLAVEVKRARRHGFPVALALIAFDPLDPGAREALREPLFGGLALAIRRSLRDTDYPVQYSAGRVVALMPHTGAQEALAVTRRICERVAKASLASGDRVLRPTVSIGVAAALAHGGELSFPDLVQHAQQAMERAMAAGGNRVELQEVAEVKLERPEEKP
jgi:GGDEF domain-containing protein